MQNTKKQGLYYPEFEHDSCGVGFVAHLKGKKTHQIIKDGIHILERLTHRGACGCDPETGDGAGIITQIPDKFFQKVSQKQGFILPKEGNYAAGNIFLPNILEERDHIEEWMEHIINEEGQELLYWRDIPYNKKFVGKVASELQPIFRQVFIKKNTEIDQETFDRKLYIIRKRLDNKVLQSNLQQKTYYYTCSLSSKTIVYKGQLMAEQVQGFFKDLNDKDFESAISMVHSRYSTNTFPSWGLAHPFRMLAHNGEINTLRGNANWMRAREGQISCEKFGEDIENIFPIITPGGSDSAGFDNVFEMLYLSGRPLPLVAMMMIPEAWSGDDKMLPEKKAFYEYYACLMEPWDGPASVGFTDGRYIGAVLDRNGLRPSRYLFTSDDIVVMASEAGVLPIAEKRIIKKGRLKPGKMFLIDTKKGKMITDKELKKTI